MVPPGVLAPGGTAPLPEEPVPPDDLPHAEADPFDEPAPRRPAPRRRRPPVDPVKVAAYRALDHHELRRLLDRQGTACLACGRSGPANTISPREEHVLLDRTGTVRGFICRTCENWLAQWEYDADRIANALRYLDAIHPVTLARTSRYGSWPGACYACGRQRSDQAAEFPPLGEPFCPACAAAAARHPRTGGTNRELLEALDRSGFVPPIRDVHMEE